MFPVGTTMLSDSLPRGMSRAMQVAGVDVRDGLILELALALGSAGHGDTAARLEDALLAFDSRVSLTIEDREALCSVLDTRRSELNHLHLVLLNEAKWRKQIGLVEHRRERAVERNDALFRARERLARSLAAAERARTRIERSQSRIHEHRALLADLDRGVAL